MNELWQPSCQKWEEKKKIIKKNCGNKVAINEEKKKDVTSTTFLQHFHNKLQVVSCYWFKFEPNTKITFLLQ